MLPLLVTSWGLCSLCSMLYVNNNIASGCDVAAFVHSVVLRSETDNNIASGCDVGAFVHSVFSTTVVSVASPNGCDVGASQ